MGNLHIYSDQLNKYRKDLHRIPEIGHSEYKPEKTDPGELFDFERLFNTKNESITKR